MKCDRINCNAAKQSFKKNVRNFRGRYLAEETHHAFASLRISAKAILTACLKI